MKFLIVLIATCIAIACNTSKESTGSNNSNAQAETDSLLQKNYRLLKEYAICRCLYATPENQSVESQDISPSVYANLVSYAGIDTLGALARQEGQKIIPEKYADYQNKKATFYRCSEWANSPMLDSLLWKFARAVPVE